MKMCPNPTCADRVSLGVAGKYVDSVEICPQCGTRLVVVASANSDRTTSSGIDADLKMVCVLRTADEALATLVKSLLDGNDIRYVVTGEGLQDLFGWGRIGGGDDYVVGPAEFLVHQDDADRARALLTATEGVSSEFPESD